MLLKGDYAEKDGKKTRNVEEAIFLEPTTGRQYRLDNAPYYSIEAIFNHLNFWVNLDPLRPIEQIDLENFEEDPNGEWEYVMIKTEKKQENEDQLEDINEDSQEIEQEDVLDMPPPWSPKLYIEKEKFSEGVKDGAKTVFYKKCRVDFYSECHAVDGLVKKVTLYEDYRRIITKEIRCYFKNRKDRLVVRRRFPFEFKKIEHYESSGPVQDATHWKKIIEVDGESRKLYFYHHRVKDGLIYREEHVGKKTFEFYNGREDKLIYRSVTFDPDQKPTDQDIKFRDNHHPDREAVIKKMTQKFELDPSFPASAQIKKTEFNLQKNEVYIYYHFRDGCITAAQQTFRREDLIG